MTTRTKVWHDSDLAQPHHVADKARRVKDMFAAIAPSYDLNNRVHSLWRDQAWRRHAVMLADICPGDVVLDVACGTGDLTLAFATTGARQVIGVDFTLPMLQLAGQKTVSQSDHPLSDCRYCAGDAMALPIGSNCIDVVSIAFGIRNVTDPVTTLQQFHRVLRPGGRLLILEFGLPNNRLLRAAYNMYFHHVLPRTAALLARDRSGAYKYLPSSVNTFMERSDLLHLIRQAGFTNVTANPLTAGIAVIYHGFRK